MVNPQQISAIVKAVDKLDDVLKVGHEIAELIPNSDRKGEIFQIGGATQADLAHQQSAFMAQYQLFNNTFGIEPANFKNWAKQFEECFPTIQKTSPYIDGNSAGAKPWGQPFDNRPRIRVLNAGDKSKQIPTYLYIEFFPERKNEKEVYFISGTVVQCVERIWNIWYLRQIIANQNFAQLLGDFPGDWLRKKPSYGISAVFICSNYKTKPFWKSSDRPDFAKAQITIPFILKSKLSYTSIRQALGGANGMDWGNSRAIAWVADDPKNFAGKKGMPQSSCNGSSYENAKSNVKRLLSALSFGKIVEIQEGGKSDKSETINPNSVKAAPARMYPNLMYLLNSYVVSPTMTEGRETVLAKMSTRKNRFEIFEDVEPEDFQENLAEILQYAQ